VLSEIELANTSDIAGEEDTPNLHWWASKNQRTVMIRFVITKPSLTQNQSHGEKIR
jgi:hypothetical protein